MPDARNAALACRRDLARWIAMSAPQSRRVAKLLERAFDQAAELGRARGAKERRDKPLRMPELRRRGQLYIDNHLPQPSGVANELRILMALAEGRDPMKAPKPKISLAPGYQHELGL